MIYNPSTRLYGVIGNPVGHSASPRLFNTVFQAYGYNGVYLAFQNSSVEKMVAAMRSLSIAGYSVTIPFKEEVMTYLDEVDISARRVGCANTIGNDGGRLVGYNTDGRGALEGLEEFSTRHPERRWRDAHLVFLGNGGAARGVLLATVDPELGFRGRITVVARNLSKTEKLLADARSINPEVSFTSQPWEVLEDSGFKKPDQAVVINTTSLGMAGVSPGTETSPVSADFWAPGMVAYDIVYNPLHTRFLRDAEASGAHVITGLNMFLGQARLQLRIWTGIEVGLGDMHDYFEKAGRGSE